MCNLLPPLACLEHFSHLPERLEPVLWSLHPARRASVVTSISLLVTFLESWFPVAMPLQLLSATMGKAISLALIDTFHTSEISNLRLLFWPQLLLLLLISAPNWTAAELLFTLTAVLGLGFLQNVLPASWCPYSPCTSDITSVSHFALIVQRFSHPWKGLALVLVC